MYDYIMEGQLWRPLGGSEYMIIKEYFGKYHLVEYGVIPYREYPELDEEGTDREELLKFIKENGFIYCGFGNKSNFVYRNN